MFFDKILDFFRIDREDEETYFPNYHKISDSMTSASNNQQDESGSSDIIYEIFDYWRNHNYSSAAYAYHREASYREKQDYALIDILSCFSKGARNLDHFSPNMLHNLGITNWNAYVRQLISKGYIEQANAFETLTATYTVQDLKTIAESIGVTKTGKKAELTQRIINALSPSDIDQILDTDPLYVLSEKGIAHLEGNEDYMILHKYLYLISLAEFNDNRIPNGGRYRRNFYDTMFQVLSNRKFFYECNGNFSDAGLTALHIGNLMLEEYKKTTHAVPLSVILTNYVEYLYLSSCFCFHANSALSYGICSNNYIGYSLPILTKGTELLSDQEPYISYDMIWLNKPPSFLTHEEFKLYIHELLTSPMFDSRKWNLKLQNRVREFDDFIKEQF